MKLARLMESMALEEERGDRSCDVKGVVCDSRQVKPGYLFVAVSGARQDGQTFIKDALQRGATVIVTSRGDFAGQLPDMPPPVCHVQVPDTRKALGQLASAFHERPGDKLQAIGITGTNGKTTVAYMVRNVLRAVGRTPGIIGTVEYEIGSRKIPASRTTPEAPVLQSMLAQMVGVGCKSVVMEVSSHALVQSRTEGIDFDVGVFTNLTRDHLDYHGSMEEYFDAKSLLFSGLGRGRKKAAAVINADDAWGRRLVEELDMRASLVTYGLEHEADVMADEVELRATGSRFHVNSPWGEARIETPLMGKFNVSNTLAAFATAGVLGLEVMEISEALKTTPIVPGRLERIQMVNGVQVFVDYAHTDDALKRVLETLREVAEKRLIVVFGCGGNRDKGKRPAMGRVASLLADYSILTSDNPRMEDPKTIIEEIRAGFETANHCRVVVDRAEAIGQALSMAAGGDVVLIAGKGHETFQEFGNRTVPFDDRQIVKEYA